MILPKERDPRFITIRRGGTHLLADRLQSGCARRTIGRKTDLETFFAEAPAMHPNVVKITGVVCGVRVEKVEDPLMRKIRYLDKLVDELAKGRPMEKILRPWTRRE